MKKKILLSLLIVSALICLLTFSVSAAATDEFGEIEIVAGMNDKSAFGEDSTSNATSRVVMFDGTEYHTYPSYYICKNSTQTEPTFDELNEKTGITYDIKSVIRIEFPQNITKTQSKFRYMSNVVYIHLPPTVVQIGQDEFHNCSALTYINVPRDCTYIGNYAFNGCSNLEVLDMTEAKSLKSTGSNFGGNKITSLIFPEGFESFGGMSSASYLVEVKFPYTLKTMGRFQFAGFTEFVVPDNLTSLGGKTFDYCLSLEKVTIPKSLTSIDTSNNGTFFHTTPKEIIYTGSETDAVIAQIKSVLPNVTITYANHCDVYYNGEHVVDLIEYKHSSFIENSIDQGTCTRCGKTATITTYDPIMTFVGYSAKINGDKICASYTVNKAMVEVYTSKTGKTISMGVSATVVADGTQKYNPVKDDLTSSDDKTVTVPIKHEYSGFDFVLSGFTSAYYEKNLVMCAYVYDGSKILYVDLGGCNEYATPFTFDSIAK